MNVSPTETKSSTDQTVIDVLKRIEARLTDPSRWCRKAYARGRSGRPVSTKGRAVVATCLEGAAMVETDYPKAPHIYASVSQCLFHASSQVYPGRGGAIAVNDILGHEAVMGVVRRAIELAESEVRS